MALKYRYLGGGYLPGIPARDLTDEDMAALSDAQRADVAANAKLDGALYEDAKPIRKGE